MRPPTPYPDIVNLLSGHERRDDTWCWRPSGTPTWLLIHTRSGQGMLRTTGDEGGQPISAGDTLMWAAGAPQDFGCDRSAEPWEIVWAHFRPREHWQLWLGWPILGAGVSWIPAPQPRLRGRIDEALLEMDATLHSLAPRCADFALNALERALLWLDAASPGPQQLDDRLHEAVLFIARHLGRPLSVAEIAKAVQLSPSRLSHLFKDQLGTPPARFVEQRRIERAQTLLESTSMPIGSIARATGFSAQLYFATRFKVLTHMSPTEWRRRASRQPDTR
ncbi:MAG: helix-turn-helix domain-containing protein [Actinomycetota bacterium]|nr:helix-turn-helix domain-containing protein [Actinomycetota bacterium]MDQ3627824.1 helix-turn-helix domain-containing protein [Actinomycetota bacterium]